MLKVGFIGWRGMVGAVLMNRMKQENDFSHFSSYFFSTSQVGEKGPVVNSKKSVLEDAYNLEKLSNLDVIVTCQGSDYTKKIYPKLQNLKWNGYWIDAASALRMDDDSLIVLDPVNNDIINNGLKSGIKKYVGGNCTVSLMLMAIGGLFKHNLVDWLTTMTYQAASGAGAKNMKELIAQMGAISSSTKSLISNPNSHILEIDDLVTKTMRDDNFPKENFTVPLAGSAIPWIDSQMDSGQSREEWKGAVETNKILQSKDPVFIDGICVRIGSMRCHSQALTIKLSQYISVEEIENIIAESNKWVKVISNNKEDSVKYLTPTAVTGTLSINVGRIRKLNIGHDYLTLFTVGDQLLWGAAEPIRRMLNILVDHLN